MDTKKFKKVRCFKCNKKLQLACIMDCECGKYFCMKHRYPDRHDCPKIKDRKEENKERLRKLLIKVPHGHRVVRF